MKNILFLIPPSEGKNHGGNEHGETVSFQFEKPYKISTKASKKDLKCDGKRYEEGIKLNSEIDSGPWMKAIKRYNGEMYKALGYENMTKKGKRFFENHFLIFSGMYGIIKPSDIIGNYKLPIETKGLVDFWFPSITPILHTIKCDTIISFLPDSYLKMIDVKTLKKSFIQVNFITKKHGKEVRMAHGSKKVKGEYIRNICEKELSDLNTFGGKILQKNQIIHLNIYENTTTL